MLTRENKLIVLIIFIFNGLLLSQILNIYQVKAEIDIDLIWEAKTYTSPLYDGKPLAVPNSQINIILIPLNNELTKKTYIYNWYINSNPQGYRLQTDQSGPGKQSFSFLTKVTNRNTERIDLEILDPNSEDLIYTKSINIPIIKPEIKIYNSDNQKNLINLKNSSIKTTLNYNETKNYYFNALPFFFSVNNLNQINYQWFIDSQPIETSRFMTLTITKHNQTSKILKTITLKAYREVFPFQSAESSFNFLAQ